MENKIINSDCLTALKTLEPDSIDCVITSPPYYALRDYGVDGQLGLEKTFHEYLDKLIEIFAEVKRVIKPTGTVWVNLGDSYSSNTKGDNRTQGEQLRSSSLNNRKNLNLAKSNTVKRGVYKIITGVSNKSLLNIPSRFAIRMTDELGFIQRNEIIWYKRSCMPSSVKDRFTVDFEKVFFFVKNKKYWFEQIYENSNDKGRMEKTNQQKYDWHPMNSASHYGVSKNGRNKRCVWDVTTKPYREAHFATYPEDLVKPMIQAGCPEFVCVKCGKPRIPYMEDTGKRIEVEKYTGTETKDYKKGMAQKPSETKRRILESMSKVKEKRYTSCNCNAGFTGGIVLDIFAGSGTTLKVAKDLNRRYIGIELNPEYISLIEKRLELDKLKLPLDNPEKD